MSSPVQVDDQTPLLPSQSVRKTKFPWAQFSIVLCLQVVDPLHSHVVHPFLPQLIRYIGITHGEESKVGYYVGALPSVFFLSQALSTPFLSTVSDRVGRKPVILLCFVGLTISMLCFGLSKTFPGLIFSWIVNGASDGSLVVIKSLLIEITDPTTIAKACGYSVISWHIGTILAPLIGGSLSQPAVRFPWLFGSSEFFKQYPYFLPCAAAAAISGITWLITFRYLHETVKNPVPISHLFISHQVDKDHDNNIPPLEETTSEAEKPLPFRALLIPPVLIVAGNYAFMSLITTTYSALHFLFLATPIQSGGLGLPPSTIGPILSWSEIIGSFLQVFLFPRMYDYWGAKTIFVGGVASMFPGFLCFPILSHLAKTQGMSVTVWAIVAFQSTITTGLSFSYATILIFVAAASPNKASLGATNGLCEVSVSVLKAVGPALAGSLFSLSLKEGKYFVYYILLALSGLSILSASFLPKKPRGYAD